MEKEKKEKAKKIDKDVWNGGVFTYSEPGKRVKKEEKQSFKEGGEKQ